MTTSRRQARILTMQALCEWDVQRSGSREAVIDLLGALEAPPDMHGPVLELLEAYWAARADVDSRISAAATRWTLERISPVERNAMRVAVVELLGGKTPPRVAIDEALEIAREFGGADSPRFVNGVLDAVLRKIDEAKAGETL